jgi:hypothetical protein
VNKFLGVTLAVLALAIAIVPNYTDCASHGIFMTLMNGMKTAMKCHWTALAEIAVGAPLVGVGAMLSFTKSKNGLFSLAFLGVVLGALAIALPINLIGTCSNVAEPCNTLMKPTVTALGSLTIVGSLCGLLLASRAKS